MMSDTEKDDLRRLTALEVRVDALVAQMANKVDLASLETDRSAADLHRSTHRFELTMAVLLSAFATFGVSMAVFSFLVLP